MKMRFKRFLSGFMAVATLASVIVQPVTVSASELEPEPTSFEQQYPELQDVQDTLDKDEIVEAKDIEIPYGEEFEVEVDLSGIEGVNEKKVKVLFHEAKSEAGTDFDAHTPDTYKAVYAVEPVSGHPAYRVRDNVHVITCPDRFFLFLDLHTVNIRHLAFYQFDCLHLVDGLDMEIYHQVAVHLQKLCQHLVGKFRCKDL